MTIPGGISTNPEDVMAMTPEQAFAALGEIAAILPLLIARASARVEPEPIKDELLDAKTAAPLLKMHEKSLRGWDDCPFVIVRGRRKFYSARGLDRWISERVK